MAKIITVTLSSMQRKPIMQVGQICRLRTNKGLSKRVVGLVKDVFEPSTHETTITLIKGYRPAPRSVLRNRKTVFSKIKGRII